jgi:NAD-dependent deacetylase
MKNVVIFTGAGISSESGIKTFRDSGGLWEAHRIEDVATPEAWIRNQNRVLDFYNQRRKNVLDAKPNAAHLAITKLQGVYNVKVITQNIDDLHERAGNKNVLHLHGEIVKARSSSNPNLVYPIHGWELKQGDVCEMGSQLRPHIVWFGEPVPLMETAIQTAALADVFIIIGTSLDVYPAASLIDFVSSHAVKYLIDPNAKRLPHIENLNTVKNTACIALPTLVDKLISEI